MLMIRQPDRYLLYRAFVMPIDLASEPGLSLKGSLRNREQLRIIPGRF